MASSVSKIAVAADSPYNGEVTIPISPSGCEYYLIRAHPDSTPEAIVYEKLQLALDPLLEIDPSSTDLDDLEQHQIAAISNLLKERNARTVADGQWVLSRLRSMARSEEFRLMIRFFRYSKDFSNAKSTTKKAPENTPPAPATAAVSEDAALPSRKRSRTGSIKDYDSATGFI
ncbi:hypothetical protein RUND412_002961 [Rhizina undulata]